MVKSAYSYHVFILPFLLKGINKGAITTKLTRQNWERIQVMGELPYLREDETIHYAHHFYFNKEAKELIHSPVVEGKETDEFSYLVENYIYKPTSEKEYYYRISYFASDAVATSSLHFFDLKVDYILLRYLPDLDMAYLVFSLENHTYTSLKEVGYINQYGRRIFTPFLNENVTYSEAPNNLQLLEKNQLSHAPEESDYLKTYNIMDAPRELLMDFFQLSKEAIFPQCPQDMSIYLDTIIDDRMFVHSLIGNQQLESLIQAASEVENLSTQQMQDLYSLAFVDKDAATCRSKSMLQSILEQTVYPRWAEYKSLYLVTQHSFIYLSDGQQPLFLTQYFLSEYLDMVLIVLSQRTGILKYSHDAGNNVRSSVGSILKLQENYIIFKNQFLLPEISAQEQAIDLYHLLQNALYIEKYSDLLDSQLSSLHDISQTKEAIRQKKNDDDLNYIVLFLTGVSLLPILPLEHVLWKQVSFLGDIKLIHLFSIITMILFGIIFYIRKKILSR
ncbi:hypothetical protein GGG87_06165 [Streptococcus sp. zg-86]|uniref:Uncharacterized protein n=1 Tax=Streptococcus zhangguiae TaxID=2664091 RepID=A0A6I4RFN9_9STRE|nr:MULTISPECIES: hypothetical protein [unclassified Streptococcus]MTB64576.1 hypothetical protein [Streptococcus sp. zg-86]MTB90886.1 hypothetical protein [Streptococcus sp. zg-36]MWV56690.1 hypothetical protein [Streptococcus sp. zg-70]QTH48648.1 hypothetical protein J5M87_04830 [Streptococcus sp. zg-86]